MGILKQIAADPTTRQRLVSDVTGLIDEEVARRSGVTGFAIKAGYKAVSKLRGGRMIPDAVNILLDDFVGVLEPMLQEHQQVDASGSFGTWLAANRTRASGDLLSITDRRVAEASPVVRSTYQKLRPFGEKQVQEALPAVGRLVDGYLR